jgi:putative DNA primase/helicase
MAGKAKTKPLSYEFGGNHFSPEETVCRYLQFIDPGHEDWFFVLCGIANELGEAGKSIAENWSAGWQKFNQAKFASSWKSAMSNNYMRDMGVLRKLATAGGYHDEPGQKPAPPPPPDPKRVERERRAELKRLRDQASAAGNAAAVWKMARPCKGHAYLKDKGVVGPFKGLRVIDAAEAIRPGCSFGPSITPESGLLLLIPIFDETGALQSLEAITEDGQKGFFAGAKKAGGLFVIGEKADAGTVYVVEGLATGLSVHGATGAPVIVGFDAGNLKAVAEITRRRFPEARIVIAGDLDESQTGQRKAKAAAAAVNGIAILPDFATVDDREFGDWNDLHQVAGLESVQAQIESALAAPAEPAPAAQATGENSPVDSVSRSTADNALPRDFRLTAEHVQWINKEGFPTPICGWLRVLARVRNVADYGYGLHIEFKTVAGHVRQLVILESLLEQPQELRKKLADAGLWLNRAPNVKGFLVQYLSEATPATMALSVDRPGWQEYRAYVSSGGEILHIGDAPPLVWAGEPGDPARHGQRGSLAEWQAHQGRYCVGNPTLQFAVSIALAAKILVFVQVEGGMFHFWGEQGKGKSSTLELKVSVNSPPGAKGSWEGTYVSYGQRMALYNDADVSLDEAKLAKEEDLVKVIYSAANGTDRSRSKEGLGLAREKTWKVLVSSTGEMPMIRYLRDSGQRVYGGLESRCIDIQVDNRAHGVFDELHGFTGGASIGAAFADELRRVSGLYYGTAGRAFVLRLMEAYTPETIRAFVADIRKDFDLQIPANADSAIHRAAKRFAIVAAGGELGIELGILPWQKWSAMNAALEMFEAWIKGRGGIGNRDRMEVLKQIRHYLLTHEEDQFTRNCPKCQGGDKPGMVKLGFDREKDKPEFVTCSACNGTAVMLTKTINKCGWVKRERRFDGDAVKLFHIYPEAFEREISKGHDTRTVLELLKSRKILEADGKRGPFKTKARPLHEHGAPFESSIDVYVINLDAEGWELNADVQEVDHAA